MACDLIQTGAAVPSPILHILFSESAVASLRQALAETGMADGVVSQPDDFGFGPINPSDPATRKAWVEAQLGYLGPWPVEEMEQFWASARTPDARRVVWFSRREARAFAGFLEWLWRAGDLPCDIIDLTDVMVTPRDRDGRAQPPRPAILPLMPAWQILESRVLRRAAPLSWDARGKFRRRWAELRAENAPLRVVEDGDLVSAPITQFDELLLSAASHEWRRMAWLVGFALGASLDSQLYQTGDLVLFSRVRALADSGRLEWRGDLRGEPTKCEVRLPKT